MNNDDKTKLANLESNNTDTISQKQKLITPNEVFDNIYVLNLARRTDRKLSVLQKLQRENINVQIWDAVDGSNDEIKKEYLEYVSLAIPNSNSHELELKYKQKMIKSSGAWAYLKTYKLILEDALKKKYSKILCFDDDILFHENFTNLFDIRIREIGTNFKLLYLGATQHSWNFPNALFYKDNSKVDFDKEEPYYHPLFTDGSFAVGIDSSVFNLLLEEIDKMNCAFDSGPLRTINRIHKYETFTLQPNIVIADVNESDIGSERDQIELSKKLNWEISDYKYPFHSDLVSIIMPAYNAEKTIEKSIQSILLQSYKNIELIITDDGSNDNTLKIIKSLSKKDSRIRYISNEENKGCYYSRNIAIEQSKGKYIAIQDADDISLSNRIEKQLATIIENNLIFTISRIYRSRCTIDELDLANQKNMMKLIKSRQIKNKYGNYEYHDRPILGFMTTMFRRDVFYELGLFWEHKFGADMEYIERILFHKTKKIFSKDEPNCHSYLMDGPEIQNIYKRIDEVLLISPKMNNNNITNSYTVEEREEFISNWRNKYIEILNTNIKN